VGVIINDRVDVALAAGAAGAHVGQDDLPAAAARRLLGADRLLGVSVKTVEQALRAQADGADYLGAGAGARHARDCHPAGERGTCG
jgi:thiamine-phosphate diphosphorylase